MISPLRILEISIPHASLDGTLREAMHLPNQVATAGYNTVFVLPWMKVSRSHSRSPYAVIDHRNMNDTIGRITDAMHWIARCHDAGLQVVLDLPLNHTSPFHIWTTHEDWYVKNERNEMHPPVGTAWNDVVQINHLHGEVLNACIDVVLFWRNLGVNGFRLDAASHMPDSFLESLITKVRQSMPGDVVFWTDGKNYAEQRPIFDAWLHHEAFRWGKDEPKHWRESVASDRGNGIYYLTNHDTLRSGLSPLNEWPGSYFELRECLQASGRNFLQSWSEWKDVNSCYSFLLK